MNQLKLKINQRRQVAITEQAFKVAKRLQAKKAETGIPSTIGGIISEIIMKEEV